MLNSYLYVHLPLNTTSLPVLSLKADSAAAAEEATSMQLGNKQHSVSMVTALTDSGKFPKTSTGLEDGPGLSVVTASSDRRHFWTDDNPSRSLDHDGRSGSVGSSNSVERNPLSSSTPASPAFLSSTPPSSVTFNSLPSEDLTSSTAVLPSVFSTPPTTPVVTHSTPISLSKPAGLKIKKKSAVSLKVYIKNLLWRFYQFLMILFKASFVPVSDRMITLLAKEQETRSPLSNALLCFVTELTSQTTDKAWLCDESLQLGLLSLFGKQLDR